MRPQQNVKGGKGTNHELFICKDAVDASFVTLKIQNTNEGGLNLDFNHAGF